MSIVLTEHTRVIIQGITGKQGSFHAEQMLQYGTKIVAGVSPGHGGEMLAGIPVCNSVKEAVERYGADVSALFVPAPFVKDAAMEAIHSGIPLLVLLTEHVPMKDTMALIAYAKQMGTTIVGPNTFGLVTSGKSKIGIAPNRYFVPGPVGVISRSGTLSYEIVGALAAEGIGTSSVIGLGGDRIVGLDFIDVIKDMEQDPSTELIVMIGEIGGSAEEKAAAYIKEHVKKPVVAYLAGKSAPPGKTMGHAGAIVERGKGTFEGKVKALEEAGVSVATVTFEVPQLVASRLHSETRL